MRSTLQGTVPPYIGVDLTDRYSRGCRPSDVCGLVCSENGRLAASFWFWQWDPAPGRLDVTAIIRELTPTRAAMFDGPQGLANSGNSLRVYERLSKCVGKTPDVRPIKTADLANFTGLICSSLDLFAALTKAGTTISPAGFIGGVSEVYPGHIWQILAGPYLPNKKSDEGRLVRKSILEALGVAGLPGFPTHDQNDACVAALLAAAADGVVPGVTARGIGVPLAIEPDGTLREGQMVIPDLTTQTRARVSKVISDFKKLPKPQEPVFVPAPPQQPMLAPAPPQYLAYFIPSGNPSHAAGLTAKLTGNSGTVTSTWRIGSGTSAGTAKVRVTCGREIAEKSFEVQRK